MCTVILMFHESIPACVFTSEKNLKTYAKPRAQHSLVLAASICESRRESIVPLSSLLLPYVLCSLYCPRYYFIVK